MTELAHLSALRENLWPDKAPSRNLLDKEWYKVCLVAFAPFEALWEEQQVHAKREHVLLLQHY